MIKRTFSRFDRILILMLLAFTLIIWVSAYLYYANQKVEIQRAAGIQLSAITDLKVAEIRRWREERLNDANLILHSSLVGQMASQFLRDTNDAALRSSLLEMMEHWKTFNHYRRAVLLNTNLTPCLAGDEEDSWLGPMAKLAADETLRKKGGCTLSDLHLGVRSGRPNLDVIVPVWSDGEEGHARGRLTGLFMFEVDARDFLYPQLQTWPTPSKTAETLLVRRDGNDVLFLNELRHKTNTALRLRIPITTNNTLPAMQAALGKSGIIKGNDYRGELVIASIGPVPGTPWYIVSKQDISEINGPLREKAWFIGIVSSVLLLSIWLGGGLLWRTREAHFKANELAEKATSEAALKYSYSLLRATLESTADGLLVVDTKGRVTDANEQYGRLWRLPQNLSGVREVQKLQEWCLTHVKDPAAMQIKNEEISKQPDSESFDVIDLIDGRTLERYSRPQRLDGRTVGRVWSFRDITERKRNEMHKENLTRRLQQKNQELEELIYAASHDLRSPLVNIDGFSRRLESSCGEIKLLVETPQSDVKARERLKTILADSVPKSLRYIQTGAAKMNSLISGLLHLARLGQVYMHPELLDMKALIQLVLNTMAFQIQKVNATIELGEMPSCVGDAALINQVFSNLIDNAIKYRAHGRPLIIRISGRVEKDKVVFCVADTGIGIPEDSLGKIWELFRRLNPEATEPGEGLGLKLVRRIVDRHDGRVWVESIHGEGTRFYVALPAWLNAN